MTFVRLVASREELLRRVRLESRRAHKKLIDTETLEGLLTDSTSWHLSRETRASRSTPDD